jgi:hypothetical protein
MYMQVPDVLVIANFGCIQMGLSAVRMFVPMWIYKCMLDGMETLASISIAVIKKSCTFTCV